MAKSNLSRQQQSNDTSFITLPLVDIFGYFANNKPATEVINGTFVPPEGTPKYVLELQEVLQMLESIHVLGSIDLRVTPEENCTGLGKMKVKKGSEPSIPGFEQCKTLSMDVYLNCIDTFLWIIATD